MACALLTLSGAAMAGESCIDARAGIDAAHHAIRLQLALPPGVTSLALAPFDGYRRSELLRSPDGSALVADAAIHATTPGRPMTLSMDVRGNLPRQDRAYAPFLRFADGTVAVDSDLLAPAEGAPPLCLRFVPAPGEQVVGFGQATDGELRAPGDGRRGGYVAFGTPRVDAARLPLKAFDRQTPDWAVRRLDDTIEGLVAYYRRWLPAVAMPTIFVYRMPYPPGIGGTGFHGDRLPESLTLGLLGRNWSAPLQETLAAMTGFIAHETFHVWNAAHGMRPADATATLAQEGGADLAAGFAVAALGGQEAGAWLDGATDALDNCVASLPDTGSLAGAGLAHGRLPYACGVPVMLALAAANDRHDPAAGYFRAWQRLVDRAADTPALQYHWDDLAMPDADPRVVAALREAIEGDGTYVDGVRRALSLAGFALVPNRHPSAAVRSRLNQSLVGALMAHDCDGTVDLWTQPDGFRLGEHAASCRTLQPGRTIAALLGTPLDGDDPSALREKLRTVCADPGARLPVALTDGVAPVDLACPPDLPRVPVLWRIVASPTGALAPTVAH